jgi:UPF0716 protein FxsA
MRFIFLLLPWLELFTLIQLGVQTSALTAVLYVLATFILGVAVLRRQGMGMFERLRQTQEGRIFGPELMLDDMALGLAGLLLIFPGLISDVAAVIVMIGPVRRLVMRGLSGRAPEPYAPAKDIRDKDAIEGEFRHIDD